MSFGDFSDEFEEFGDRYTPIDFISQDKRSISYLVKKSNEDSQKKFVLKKVSGIDDLPFINNPVYKKEVQSDIKRFKNEVKTLQNVNHKNIIRIEDQVITKDTFYFVTQYYESTLVNLLRKKHKELGTKREYVTPDFNDKVQDKPFLPLDTALNVMHSLLTSLDYLHTYTSNSTKSYFFRESIIHRDVQPENIYVSDNEKECMLFNFGCCSYFEKEDPQTTGNTLTDITYRHPEAENFEFLEPRIDIYSAGMTMYEMLTGHIAYAESPLTREYQRKKKVGYSFPDIISKEVSDFTKSICYKALEYDPENNNPYTDTAKMLADLEMAIDIELKGS